MCCADVCACKCESVPLSLAASSRVASPIKCLHISRAFNLRSFATQSALTATTFLFRRRSSVWYRIMLVRYAGHNIARANTYARTHTRALEHCKTHSRCARAVGSQRVCVFCSGKSFDTRTHNQCSFFLSSRCAASQQLLQLGAPDKQKHKTQFICGTVAVRLAVWLINSEIFFCLASCAASKNVCCVFVGAYSFDCETRARIGCIFVYGFDGIMCFYNAFSW